MNFKTTRQRAAMWQRSEFVSQMKCEITNCKSHVVKRTEDGALCYKCYMDTRFCDEENCSKVASLKFKGRWLCRAHLCPPPDEEYLANERVHNGGLKSSAFNWKDVTVVDYSPRDEYECSKKCFRRQKCQKIMSKKIGR